MTIEAAADYAARAMVLTLLVASPMLLAGLVVGVLISILQAVTQVQEMTLTFVPKIIAIMLAVIFLGRWMAAQLVLYTHSLLMGIPDLAGR
mgnify:CR=1 FL=1